MVVLFGMALLVTGGLVSAAAGSAVALLYAGRLLMGAGTVLVIVLLTKMMQDRFKGADLFPAMSIYVLGWPVGIAAAQAVLPGLAVSFGWQVPFLAGAAAMMLAFVAVAVASRPGSRAPAPVRRIGPADGAGDPPDVPRRRLLGDGQRHLHDAGHLRAAAAGGARPVGGGGRLRDVPDVLGEPGRRAGGGDAGAAAGAGAADGGRLHHRLGGAGGGAALRRAGLGGAILAAHGLLYALPITVFSALPALAVPPERRAQGLGVYFVWFYGGCTGFPPLAGWLADRTGGATVPVIFAAVLLLAAMAMFLAFRRMVARG